MSISDLPAIAVATIIPLVVLYVIYSLDLYQTGTFRTVLLCFGWGLVAYGLAYYANPAIFRTRIVPTWNDLSRYIAPIVEESLKALILLYIVRQAKFTYFVDGAIYGFAVGIGFAVVENYQYILASQSGLGTAIARVLSANLIHATASAMVGVTFGLARFRRTGGYIATVLAGLALAMLLHSLYNNIVTRDIPGPVLVYSVVLGLAGVGFIAFMIFRGLADQKKWIEEALGMADRVTAGEARVVQRLDQVQELLEPLAKVFGAEKAAQVERFLFYQAQLGIKRKTLEKLPDEKMRRGVEKDMEELRTKMDEARRAVGSYMMASVRVIFPEGSSPVFGVLEQRIQEKIAARPASGGMNLWANLGSKTTKAAAEGETPPVSEENESSL